MLPNSSEIVSLPPARLPSPLSWACHYLPSVYHAYSQVCSWCLLTILGPELRLRPHPSL